MIIPALAVLVACSGTDKVVDSPETAPKRVSSALVFSNPVAGINNFAEQKAEETGPDSLLSLPLSAQEALIGTWEASFEDQEGNPITMRLSFHGDGGYGFFQMTELGEEFREVFEAAEIVVEEITVQGTGTYEVAGDTISAEIAEAEILAGDRPYLEVLTEVARALARVAGDLTGVSDEDYPAFEQEFVDEFLAGIEEEDSAFFEEEVTYAIEGDTLTITSPTEDGEEETIQFQRVGETAVAGTT